MPMEKSALAIQVVNKRSTELSFTAHKNFYYFSIQVWDAKRLMIFAELHSPVTNPIAFNIVIAKPLCNLDSMFSIPFEDLFPD